MFSIVLLSRGVKSRYCVVKELKLCVSTSLWCFYFGLFADSVCMVGFIISPQNEYFRWLVVLRFNATLTAKVISWQSVTHIWVSWLSHTSRNTTFFFFGKKSCVSTGLTNPGNTYASPAAMI